MNARKSDGEAGRVFWRSGQGIAMPETPAALGFAKLVRGMMLRRKRPVATLDQFAGEVLVKARAKGFKTDHETVLAFIDVEATPTCAGPVPALVRYLDIPRAEGHLTMNEALAAGKIKLRNRAKR